MSDSSFSWADAGRKVAGLGLPLLGTALLGPAGGAIGGIVASALGCESTPQSVTQTIDKDTQAALIALQTVQENNRVHLEELVIAAETERRKLAYSRETTLAAAGSKTHYGPTATCIIVGVGFFAILGYILNLVSTGGFDAMSQPAVLILGSLLGTLAASFTAAINYQLGSSLGSKAKGDDMAKLVAQAHQNAANDPAAILKRITSQVQGGSK